MKVLQVNASARRDGNSTRVANTIIERLRAENPEAELITRDLAASPHPALDEGGLTALTSPAAARSPEQAARVALDDELIAELQAADVLVLGVPMYNFGVPAQLKNWIDAIARAGVTFRYIEKGPQGLVLGKTVYVALARGGRHRDMESDSQVPYLKTVLAFLGMTDVHFIYAEGLNMGPEAAQQGYAQADADLEVAFA